MKILVLNGSPKRENSDTLHITRAFLEGMLETELEEQVEVREEADPEYHDSRNGYKPKTLRSSMGEIRSVG